jgi:hypothetical protein
VFYPFETRWKFGVEHVIPARKLMRKISKKRGRTSHTSLEAPRKVKDRVRIVSSFISSTLPGISKIYTTKPLPNPLPSAMLAPNNDTRSSSKYAEMLINAPYLLTYIYIYPLYTLV